MSNKLQINCKNTIFYPINDKLSLNIQIIYFNHKINPDELLFINNLNSENLFNTNNLNTLKNIKTIRYSIKPKGFDVLIQPNTSINRLTSNLLTKNIKSLDFLKNIKDFDDNCFLKQTDIHEYGISQYLNYKNEKVGDNWKTYVVKLNTNSYHLPLALNINNLQEITIEHLKQKFPQYDIELKTNDNYQHLLVKIHQDNKDVFDYIDDLEIENIVNNACQKNLNRLKL